MKRTSRDIRTANRQRVLRRIIAASPVSRQQVAADTGLSLATVATLVGELTEAGVLRDVGFEDSDGGRPRGLVAVAPEGGVLVGVDVAETYVHVELFDLALRVIGRSEEGAPAEERRPEQVVARIAAGVRAVLERSGLPRERVLGVGVSIPGQVDREGGLSVFAPNWGWQDVPLLRLLGAELADLDLPLYLDNPLKACTVAELWFGAARDREDVAVVNLGTGVGVGIAVGGSLYRGVSNSAGEWGHTTLVLDGRLCHCGNHGCVETYVGAPGIMQTLRELAPTSPMLHPGDQTATVGALARGVATGDPVAQKVLQETGRYLGAAVAALVNLLNPEMIVLSSWVAAQLGEPLLVAVRSAVSAWALPSPLQHTEIVLCPIASNPVSLGAAAFALEGALDRVRGTVPRSRTS